MRKEMVIMFNLSGFFHIGINGIAVFATLFWIWVLIDCITKESSEGNDKVAWVLIILFAPLIGALLYYFVRRPERIKTVGR
jgi:Phospholipase_D-nuclease N-terminal